MLFLLKKELTKMINIIYNLINLVIIYKMIFIKIQKITKKTEINQ